jgi:hypothetical protein
MLIFFSQLLRLRRPFVAYITDSMGNELFRVSAFYKFSFEPCDKLPGARVLDGLLFHL